MRAECCKEPKCSELTTCWEDCNEPRKHCRRKVGNDQLSLASRWTYHCRETKSGKLIDYGAVSLLLTLKKPPPQTLRSAKTSLVWQEKESSHQ